MVERVERLDHRSHATHSEGGSPQGRPEERPATSSSDEHSHYTESLQAYLHTISAKPLLSAAEERRLARAVQSGSTRAKDRLIRHNLRLVVHNARRFRGLGVEFEELIQEGTLGLIRAIEKFDPDQGYKLSTYATWWIRQKIGRAVMDQGRSVRIPVHYHEQISKLRQAENKLSLTLGREPTTCEMAEHLEVSAEKVRELRHNRRPVASLDAPAAGGAEDGRADDRDAPGLGTFLTDEDQDGEAIKHAEHSRERTRLLRLLPELPERQRFVIERRYGLEGRPVWTLDALAEEIGTHREAIRKHQKRAELNLRAMMADHSSRNSSKNTDERS